MGWGNFRCSAHFSVSGTLGTSCTQGCTRPYGDIRTSPHAFGWLDGSVGTGHSAGIAV